MSDAALSYKLSESLRDLFEGEEKIRTGQQAVESISLTILALRHFPNTSALDAAIRRLETSQNEDGSWPAFVGDGRRGCWTTALAALALLANRRAAERVSRATQWLLEAQGREANWFWRWKFQALDNSVKFDPRKYGWSWMAGTTSWVIPTSFSLIALRHVRNAGLRHGDQLNERINLGMSMLLDRMCPGGGWNAGNGVAFGVALAPYIDATSIALLALQRHEDDVVTASLSWLYAKMRECPSPYSLAWGILALAAYQKNPIELVDPLQRALTRLIAANEAARTALDTATLAVCALALAAVDGENVFALPL